MSRRRRVRKPDPAPPPSLTWEDGAGFHALLAGTPPEPATLARMEDEMRQMIRSSPMWDEIVREHGTEGAEALLQQIKGRLGP